MLTTKELHNLAMNVVGKQLEDDGFEFLAVNSQLKKDPQFVCTKNKQLHFIVVKAVIYPNNPKDFDASLMQTVKKHADTFEAITYFAGVGFAHAESYDLPLTKNAPYAVNYDGLQKI
ncbi:MAG: Na(+)-translocating NADH-quinone reductase subunit F [Flavobacteriaceae bacterium]|jgi:hypothetical protein|nr:Na(+)-translocating NADH-quinone reductase subunit F [Flavobacteriaceae bacterium]